jgi:hypothetical protein
MSEADFFSDLWVNVLKITGDSMAFLNVVAANELLDLGQNVPWLKTAFLAHSDGYNPKREQDRKP